VAGRWGQRARRRGRYFNTDFADYTDSKKAGGKKATGNREEEEGEGFEQPPMV
jgi:hypothetical protein